MSFALDVKGHLKWESSVAKDPLVQKWDSMLITRGIVCSIFEIKSLETYNAYLKLVLLLTYSRDPNRFALKVFFGKKVPPPVQTFMGPMRLETFD